MNKDFDPNERNLEIIQTLMNRLNVIDCEEISGKVNEVLGELALAVKMFQFHPRAAKLMGKRKNFVVIACDEPYYMQAYSMIREHEKKSGRWSENDEQAYQAGYSALEKPGSGAGCWYCGMPKGTHKPDCPENQ